MKISRVRYESRTIPQKMQNNLISIIKKMNQSTQYSVNKNGSGFVSECVNKCCAKDSKGKTVEVIPKSNYLSPVDYYIGYSSTIHYDGIDFEVDEGKNAITPIVEEPELNFFKKIFSKKKPKRNFDSALFTIQKVLSKINRNFDNADIVTLFGIRFLVIHPQKAAQQQEVSKKISGE